MWLTLMIKMNKIVGASAITPPASVGGLLPWIRRNRRR